MIPTDSIIVGTRRRKNLGDIQSLADSIAAIGLLHPPVVTPDHRLIAGERRLAAVRLLGWTETPVTVLDLADILRGEHDENVERLDLSPSEAVDIARAVEDEVRTPVGVNKAYREDSESFAIPSGRTVDKAATYVGMSGRTLEKARRVVEAAEADPVLLPLVEKMDKTGKVDGAYKALQKVERETARIETDLPQTLTARVMQSDACDFLRMVADSGGADLLLTDPPYSTDVDDVVAFARHWLPVALDAVKPTGRAYIFTGSYPQEMHAYLDVLLSQQRLMLDDVLVWAYRNTIGPAPSMGYKRNWQACFYLRGSAAPSLNCELLTEQFSAQIVNAPDARHEVRYHTWQKPDDLVEQYIRHATTPGQLVIDPFAGTGTHLLAAARLGRQGWGCDTNPAMLAICDQRGLTVTA